MIRSTESLKGASEAFVHAMKQTGTRLAAITRNRLQSLRSCEVDPSELERLKRLNERPSARSSYGERLKGSLLSRRQSIVWRCKEEYARNYWKTGVRETCDENDIFINWEARSIIDSWENIAEA